MDDETRVEMERALAEHYGEPVRPVSHYCRAFEQWGTALAAKISREDKGTEPGTPDHRDESLRSAFKALTILRLPIHKSNLLWRMIYDGQPLLTEMCPVHKGQWQGCPLPGGECPCGCTIAGNTTGWLPTHSTEA